MLKPSMFLVCCESEKFSCEGKPTATLRLLDTVAMAGVSVSLAATRTGVGIVPELTRTVTRPVASETWITSAMPPSIVTPPLRVSSVSVTLRFGRMLPAPSRTSKVKVEVSVKPEALM